MDAPPVPAVPDPEPLAHQAAYTGFTVFGELEVECVRVGCLWCHGVCQSFICKERNSSPLRDHPTTCDNNMAPCPANTQLIVSTAG
jgi:hypothetical protein